MHSFLCLQILKNITWYSERVLTEISLGSLLILVVIRTIQYNMTRTRVSVAFGAELTQNGIIVFHHPEPNSTQTMINMRDVGKKNNSKLFY